MTTHANENIAAIYATLDRLDMRVIRSLPVIMGGWKLPGDIIGRNGLSLILFRPADADYRFDGWEPWLDGRFGGRGETLASVVNWLAERMEEPS